MKKAFPHYYKPDFQKLWNEALFAFDSNVLLSIYESSEMAKRQIIEVLEHHMDRLFIPHQFALEYLNNRPTTILKQVANYQKAEKRIKDLMDDLRANNRHPFIGQPALDNLNMVLDELAKHRKDLDTLIHSDRYQDRIAEIFAGRVVGEMSEDTLEAQYKKAAVRFDDEIPPGYKDRDKPHPERYNDYIGWFQIIRHATEVEKPVILVTDDAKEDWWDNRGKDVRKGPLGPRLELIAEFMRECKQGFWLYRTDRFLEYAALYLGEQINQEALDEIREQRTFDSDLASDVETTDTPDAESKVWTKKPLRSRAARKKGIGDPKFHLSSAKAASKADSDEMPVVPVEKGAPEPLDEIDESEPKEEL